MSTLRIGAFLLGGLYLLAARPVAAEPPFTVVVLPDTQFYVAGMQGGSPSIFSNQVNWIISNRVSRNIAFVLHEGDITQSNSVPEWSRAKAILNRLDEHQIPYFLAVGNHDLGPGGDCSVRESLITDFFPLSVITNRATWGGGYETGRLDNAYYLITAGNVDWLILVLEFGPRDAVLDWAAQVLAGHADRQAILLTHTHTHTDNTLHGSQPEHESLPRQFTLGQHIGYPNHGPEVWEKLIRRQRNIAFVISGHVGIGAGGGRLLLDTGYGTPVHSLLANYQHLAGGGNGYLRIMEFVPDEKKVDVKTYSPWLNQFLTDPANQFVLADLAVFDRTPPDPPDPVHAEPLGARRIRLTWPPAVDAGSGIACYIPRREEGPVAIIFSNQYVFTGLTESTTYPLDVLAMNRAGRLSAPAATVSTTLPDIQPPQLLSAEALCDRVTLVFNEPVAGASVSNLAHFQIAANVPVVAAELRPDLRTAILHAPHLSGGSLFTLTVYQVADRAAKTNVMTRPVTRKLLNQACYLADDFHGDTLTDWSVVDVGNHEGPSRWVVTNGTLQQLSNIFGPAPGLSSNRMGSYVWWNPPEALLWNNYSLEVVFRTADDDGVGVLFNLRDHNHYYKLDMDQQQNFRKLLLISNRVEHLVAYEPGGYALNSELRLRVENRSDYISVRLNDQELFGGPVPTPGWDHGTVALHVNGSMGVTFHSVRVLPLDSTVSDDDLDGDGIPDSWEQLLLHESDPDDGPGLDDIHFGSDWDGDGIPDGEEWMAGTDARNPASRFAQLPPQWGSEGVAISWFSISNKKYRVSRAAELGDEYHPVWNQVPATPPLNTATDNVLLPSAFYRIELAP